MSIMECPSQDRSLVTDLQEWLGLGHPPAGAPEPWDKALEEVMGQGANRLPYTCCLDKRLANLANSCSVLTFSEM